MSMIDFDLNKINSRILDTISVLCSLRNSCENLAESQTQEDIDELAGVISDLDERINVNSELIKKNVQAFLTDLVGQENENVEGVESENGIEL